VTGATGPNGGLLTPYNCTSALPGAYAQGFGGFGNGAPRSCRNLNPGLPNTFGPIQSFPATDGRIRISW